MKFQEELEQDCYYHIYNRAVGNELLFQANRDYLLFLKKFKKYLADSLDVYAYCLLPNHFHFLVRIKSELKFHSIKREYHLEKEKHLYQYISQKFSNFFNSYSKSYNLYYKRKGSLFMRPFKRIKIDNNQYFTQIIYYIHRNPLHHNITKQIEDWKYSSYRSIVSNANTDIQREEVLKWFGGIKEFENCHQLIKVDWINNFISLD